MLRYLKFAVSLCLYYRLTLASSCSHGHLARDPTNKVVIARLLFFSAQVK